MVVFCVRPSNFLKWDSPVHAWSLTVLHLGWGYWCFQTSQGTGSLITLPCLVHLIALTSFLMKNLCLLCKGSWFNLCDCSKLFSAYVSLASRSCPGLGVCLLLLWLFELFWLVMTNHTCHLKFNVYVLVWSPLSTAWLPIASVHKQA